MSDANGLPELPRGWVWAPLGDISTIKLGKMLSPKAFERDLQQLPYLRNENVRWFSIDMSDVKSMGFALNEVEKFRLRVGDLLVCEGGEPGRCAVVTHENSHFMYQKALHRVRPIGDTIDSRFLQYFFKRFIDSGTIIERRSETTIQHLPREKMVRVPVPLPPRNEQARIVSKIDELLSDLDAGVAALERVRLNLKRYRAAVLKAAVEGRLTESWRQEHPSADPASKLLERILIERRQKWEQDQLAKCAAAGKPPPKHWREKYQEPSAPDTANLPDLPPGWCWATVEQLGCPGEQTVLTGPFGSTLGREDFVSSGVALLTIGCLTQDGITLDKAFYVSEAKARELERYRVRMGDLLFSRSASVGRAGYVTSALAGSIINYHLMRLRVGPVVILPFYFICFVRGSTAVVTYLRRVNHGATRDGINTADLLSMPVALPSIEEQEQIVAEVESRLSVVRKTEQELDGELQRSSRLRQSILKRAFEGKLVPQDPADETAGVLLGRIQAARATSAPSPKVRKQPKSRATQSQILSNRGLFHA